MNKLWKWCKKKYEMFIYILNSFTYAIALRCGSDKGGNYVKYVCM